MRRHTKAVAIALVLASLTPGLLVAQDVEAAAEAMSSELAAKLGLGVESIQMEGETWTRLHFFPMFPLWKFRFGLDFELFINGEGQISDKGWSFATPDAAIDTITRKIYYIGFNDKPDVVAGDSLLYLRVGALPSVTLGQGIILRDYTNTLDYPLERKLGVDLAVGNITPLGIGIEAVAPDVTDFARGGGVVGARAFLSPLGFTSIPLLKNLQVGASYVADFNQYGGLKDSDGDSYPDGVDRFPGNADLWADTDGDGVADSSDTDADGDQIPDFSDLTEQEKSNLSEYLSSTFGLTDAVDLDVQSEELFSLEGKTDPFSMIGADVIIPVLPILSIYAQYAQTYDPQDTDPAEGWGLASPGIKLSIGQFLNIDLGYRRSEGEFRFGYFGQNYDNQRAVIQDPANVYTNEDTLTSQTMNGVYGSISADLFIINILGSYEHLIPTDGGDQKISFEARAGLNAERLAGIPVLSDYLDDLSAYFLHDTVSQLSELITPSPKLLMGADLQLRIGGSMLVTYSVSRTFDTNGEPVDSMSVGTSATF